MKSREKASRGRVAGALDVAMNKRERGPGAPLATISPSLKPVKRLKPDRPDRPNRPAAGQLHAQVLMSSQRQACLGWG